MSDARLIDLESRLAYQDETLRVLGDEVARQQRLIEQLQRRCAELAERLAAQAAAPRVSAADERPPHY